MPALNPSSPEATAVAVELGGALDSVGVDYAVGGAIALGVWSEPRGTLDVDLMLFWPPDDAPRALDVLHDAGCAIQRSQARASIEEHGYCRVSLHGVYVDVFFPTVPFHEQARDRRTRVTIHDRPLTVWNAEVVAVLKMMFFRRKDLADVEQLLRVQGSAFERDWVRDQLVELFGRRDPRVAAWDELAVAIPPE